MPFAIWIGDRGTTSSFRTVANVLLAEQAVVRGVLGFAEMDQLRRSNVGNLGQHAVQVRQLKRRVSDAGRQHSLQGPRFTALVRGLFIFQANL
jgi:hypothetical protein